MFKKTAFSMLLTLTVISASASIIKKPPVKIVDIPYPELVCTKEDQECIYEIITSVASNSKIVLLFQKNHLDQLAAKIDHVHPMKFFTTIFNHPHLRQCLLELWPDAFKRAGFLEGFATSMSREADKGKLNQHIEAFATELNVFSSELTPFFETRSWEEMVSYLIGDK